MYYVGICDDDLSFIKYIKRLFCKTQEEIKFYEYLSGEELVGGMQAGNVYDLLILDVWMPGMDGNETAKEFRKQFPDTLLVFCSGVCMPTVESFETTPYRYWLKIYTEAQLDREIEGLLCKMRADRVAPDIIGKKESSIIRLRPEQVLYIAIAKRGTVLHGMDLEEYYTSTKRLAEFYEQLREFGFAYAHNSYIVNMKHVKAVNRKELELINGEKLTVSRARTKEFARAFAVELAKKYGE